MNDINAELQRTAFQKKTVSRLPAKQVLDQAIAFFREHGYRAGRTGRPNQVFVMGGAEGKLPRVTGNIAARADVGKPGVTLVTMDASGERLGPLMAEFYASLRAQYRASRQRPATAAAGPLPQDGAPTESSTTPNRPRDDPS